MPFESRIKSVGANSEEENLQSSGAETAQKSETDSAGLTIMGLYLMPLNCTLINGENGKLYVMDIFPQFVFKDSNLEGHRAYKFQSSHF